MVTRAGAAGGRGPRGARKSAAEGTRARREGDPRADDAPGARGGGAVCEPLLTRRPACPAQHWDHAGGNEKFASLQPGVEVVGGKGDSVPCATSEVGHGDTVAVGSLRVRSLRIPHPWARPRPHPRSVWRASGGGIRLRPLTLAPAWQVNVLYTPCHTPGHVCYHVDGDPPLVFTGDTMFVAGCGNFNSGTPAMMHHAMVEVLGKLPPATRVYCGHEYTGGRPCHPAP